MSKQEQKTANRNGRAFLAYGLLTLVVVIIAIGGISAKYFKEIDQENGTISAKNFYFESDQLDEHNPEYHLAAGTEKVTFALRNFADNLNWAEDTIHYTVTVSGGAMLSASEGDLTGDEANAKEFTLSGLKDGGTYVVTATSGKTVDGENVGYVKTLMATFVVDTDNHAYMSLSTSGPQVILTIWTENVTGKASFTIPAGLIPNVTESPELSGVTNYNEVASNYSAEAEDGYHYGEHSFVDSAEFGVYTTKAYYFIKEKPSDTYTLGAFGEVIVGDVTAVEATP